MKNAHKFILAAGLAALVLWLSVAVRSPFETAHGQTKPVTAKTNGLPVPAGIYNLDPLHSRIGFSIRHFEINWVEGRFKDFTGKINYDQKDVTKSIVEFAAKIESVDTGVEPRDRHLRTADFFDAAKYPEMTFKSVSVERRGKNGLVLNGNLTIKGVTKPVSLPFTMTEAIKDPWGNTRFGIEARAKINRRAFGINYGGELLPGGGADIGNEVTISLLLEAVKSEPGGAE